MDASESKRVLANAIRKAYSDLFDVNRAAHAMTSDDVGNKIKTLTEGQHSDAVVQKMASTFKALTGLADFSSPSVEEAVTETEPAADTDEARDATSPTAGPVAGGLPKVKLDGLAYNIHINLPDSRDPAVFEAIFRSMKEHLFN